MRTRLNRFQVSFDNSVEFHRIKREVFGAHTYFFESTSPRLRIIDGGAHIGLTTLYFKQLYPQAEIIALEPNPQVFKLLNENVFQNDLKQVETRCAALSDSEGELEFHVDAKGEWYSTGSIQKGAWTGEEDTKAIQVPAISLGKLLDRPTQLVKLDVEGAEQKVLLAAGEKLRQVGELLIEFHPTPNQSLGELLDFLAALNFQIRLEKRGKTVKSDEATGLVLIKAKAI